VDADDLEPWRLTEPKHSNNAPPGTDAATMARVREKFLDFIDGEYHRVVRFLMLAGATRQDAEDATQEAFLQAWREVTSGRWESIGNPRGWIRKVAWYARLRPPGQKRVQPQVAHGVEPPDFAEPGPGHAELTEQTQTVLDALASLPEAERIVMAFTIDRFTSTQTAMLLRLTQQKVLDLRKQARKALSRSLAPTSGRKEDVR
jgi:RNA polymerase sigma factor (sigma-70 family)